MSNKLQELKDGKYTQKFVAGLLYPNMNLRSAMAKLNSKLWNTHKRRLTEDEIKKIEEIIK